MTLPSELPHLVLLPGFDGTGELFESFIRELGPEWPIHVVRYRDEVNFQDYVDSVASRLPERDVVLIAESFSGPIAIALLARYEARIRAAVLCATFATTPFRALTRLARFVPSAAFGMNAGRGALLRRFCLDAACDPQLFRDVLTIGRSLPPLTIKRRLELLASVDVRATCGRIRQPVLIMEAVRDRLLGRRPAELRALLPDATISVLDGPHLLLQAQPRQSAEAIKRFLVKVAG